MCSLCGFVAAPNYKIYTLKVCGHEKLLSVFNLEHDFNWDFTYRGYIHIHPRTDLYVLFSWNVSHNNLQ